MIPLLSPRLEPPKRLAAENDNIHRLSISDWLENNGWYFDLQSSPIGDDLIDYDELNGDWM